VLSSAVEYRRLPSNYRHLFCATIWHRLPRLIPFLVYADDSLYCRHAFSQFPHVFGICHYSPTEIRPQYLHPVLRQCEAQNCLDFVQARAGPVRMQVLLSTKSYCKILVRYSCIRKCPRLHVPEVPDAGSDFRFLH
jgi:hypothetical protein